MSEMKDSRLYTRSLLLCQGFTTALYIIVGVVVSPPPPARSSTLTSPPIQLTTNPQTGLLLLRRIHRLPRPRFRRPADQADRLRSRSPRPRRLRDPIHARPGQMDLPRRPQGDQGFEQ